MTHIANITQDHGLTQSQIATIIAAAKALPKPNRWVTSQFPCACCGQVTAVVSAHNENAHVPEFEFVHGDGRVLLDVLWASGESYNCEVWSVAAALRIMRSAVAEADRADKSVFGVSPSGTRHPTDGGLKSQAV